MQRRVAIAQWYRRSPLLKQRHASPIGHFFGVPEPSEVNDAMNELVARLGRSGLLGVEATDLVGQTAEICGAVAGRTMRPARHLDEVAGRIKELLEGSS